MIDFSGYPEKLVKILSELDEVLDADERAEILIEYASKFKAVPERIAKAPYPPLNKVPACESDAYVFIEKLADGKVKYYFDVNNPQGISAKALATIMAESLNVVNPIEVQAISDEIVFKIFGKELTLGKGMGLKSMVQLVKALCKN